MTEYILDVRDKLKLTEVLISQLPDEEKETVDRAMSLWWYNIRQGGGLRLTELGFYILSKVLELEHYGVDIDPHKLDRKAVLKLDRRLQMPYYIEAKKKIPVRIIMFGSREALLARLYGDLDKFLENYT